MGQKVKKKRLIYFFKYALKSVQNCLGHEDNRNYEYPLLVKELNQYKCIDVGLGKNYTVVIGSLQHNHDTKYNLNEFYECILENAFLTIEKINELKMKK